MLAFQNKDVEFDYNNADKFAMRRFNAYDLEFAVDYVLGSPTFMFFRKPYGTIYEGYIKEYSDDSYCVVKMKGRLVSNEVLFLFSKTKLENLRFDDSWKKVFD